jgi:hypothetical protein
MLHLGRNIEQKNRFIARREGWIMYGNRIGPGCLRSV